jgi:hypothetical protein
MRRRTALTIPALVLLSDALSAKTPVDPVNRDRNGFAIKGYDPVGYFEQKRPVKGGPTFTHQWNGGTWQFESARTRELFISNPEKYAPQYGGYCAWAVSNNYTASIDPEAWKIIDGKLYLNYSKRIQRMWEPDAAKRIMDADRNWPGLHK